MSANEQPSQPVLPIPIRRTQGKRKLRLVSSEPSTPIEHLAASVRRYLHLSDPSPLYALMGAVAGNMISGKPIWLMLVGPPSSGGSVLLETLMGLPHVHGVGLVDSVAAFLSGTGKKDRDKEATGGLLRQVGDHGCLVLKDFTSMLSLPEKDMKKILGVFRECYDGRWDRPTGSDGGKPLNWTGKLALFSKVTGAIDQHHSVSASLGERWLYYRIPDDGSGFAKSMQALTNASRSGWEEELRDLVSGFFSGLGLSFGETAVNRGLRDAEKVRLIRMAAVAARCRSSVVRDTYSRDKDIVAPPEREVEVRIATALGQFMVGMEIVGVGEKERWRLLGKVALDSMPALRKMVVGMAWVRVDGVGLGELERETGCSRGVVSRTVEDLEVHGVVGRIGKRGSGLEKIVLTPWMREEWLKAWGENNVL